MRLAVCGLALSAIMLAGCGQGGEPPGAGAAVPAGYEVTERATVQSLEECESRVRDMTKGGQIEPQPAGTGARTYLFTLNTGRGVWQSCAMDTGGQYVHTMAVSREVLQ